MAVNLATNVRDTNNKQRYKSYGTITTNYCWLDSSVVMIINRGEYRQFLALQCFQIKSHPNFMWHHVSTSQNPEDTERQGGKVTNSDRWKYCSSWLNDSNQRPAKTILQPSEESQLLLFSNFPVTIGIRWTDERSTIRTVFPQSLFCTLDSQYIRFKISFHG